MAPRAGEYQRHVIGLLDGAVYVERASLPNQRVAPLATVDPASVPYFAAALVRCRGYGE